MQHLRLLPWDPRVGETRVLRSISIIASSAINDDIALADDAKLFTHFLRTRCLSMLPTHSRRSALF
jgi:hypothetical protein